MPIPIIIWNKSKRGLDLTQDAAIVSLASFGTNLYAGTRSIFPAYAKVYQSWDGFDWGPCKEFSDPVPGWGLPQGENVYAMAVHNDGGGDALYVAYHSAGIIWKFDGVSWTQTAGEGLGTGAFGPAFDDPCQMVSYNGSLYVTTFVGSPRRPVWSSPDGMTWTAEFTTTNMVWGQALKEFGGDLYLGGGQVSGPLRTYIFKKSAGVWDAGTQLVPPLGLTTLRTKEFVEFNGDLWAICDGASANDIHIYQLNGGAWTYRASIPHNDVNLASFTAGIGFVGQPDGAFRVGNVNGSGFWRLSRSGDGSIWGVEEIYQDSTVPENEVALPHTFITFTGAGLNTNQFFAGGTDFGSPGQSATVWTTANPPVPDFIATTPTSGPAPLTVGFDGTYGVHTTGGTPTYWGWNFGDASPTDNSPDTVSHIYTVPGVYSVTLTTINVDGGSGEVKTSFVTVTGGPPVADFVGTPLSGIAPLSVSFADLSTNVPTSWDWDFGDLSPHSSATNPVHVYNNPGMYTVTLTVTNGFGFDTETKIDYVVVSIPVADFVGVPLFGVMPLTVTFTDTSTGGPTSWDWDFGDLSPHSVLQNPVHIYNSPGMYTVVLTATNGYGSYVRTKSNYVSVVPTPTSSYTVATPDGGAYLENTVVELDVYTDITLTTPDPTAQIYWQRYMQSAEGVFDVTDRWNLAGMNPGCIHVRFFDPDNRHITLYNSPGECDTIAMPIAKTDLALQEAYQRGDYSIMLDGYDAVGDLGFEIKSMYHDDGTPMIFSEYQPGSIYINPEVGMFMFYHYPDKWDACSYWDFSWWDHTGLTGYPYTTNWNMPVPIPSITPPYDLESPHGRHPGDFVQPWDGQTTSGLAMPIWNDTINPLPINSYWSGVSEAPTADATVVVCYWTKDNLDPLMKYGDTSPSVAYSYRSHLYTAPITTTTATQLRFRSVNSLGFIEPTKTETYDTGLRVRLVRGVNLISQPKVLTPTEADLQSLFTGLDLLQVFRLENGIWQVFVPYSSSVLNDFDKIDNQHGFFAIMNGPETFCIPYGTLPDTTLLSVVNKNINQGINAIGSPRRSTADNSIVNLLDSRNVQYDALFRVTNNVFETYIPTRASVLNFSPATLQPGRGYGVVTSETQTFEIPFAD